MKSSKKQKNAQGVTLLSTARFTSRSSAAVFGDGAATIRMIPVEFQEESACGCDICRSKRLDLEEITVFEVWTDEESFVTDKAVAACGIASYLNRPVRVRSKRIPRAQYEEMQRL